jgi:histidine triad (HIT) family protein
MTNCWRCRKGQEAYQGVPHGFASSRVLPEQYLPAASRIANRRTGTRILRRAAAHHAPPAILSSNRKSRDMSECIFCAIANGKIPARKVLENEDLVAFHDLNPAAPVHVLVIPRRHIATLDDAQDADTLLLGKMMRAASEVAVSSGLSTGYRVVMNVQAGAGQSVFHVHLHVLGGREFKWPPF